MITKFMTEVTAKFNPFSACAKPARLFLTLLPPSARSTGMTIHTTLLPRTSKEPSSVYIKFSAWTRLSKKRENNRTRGKLTIEQKTAKN